MAEAEDEGLRRIGPYQCSPTVDLAFLVALFDDYFEETTTLLTAEPVYLTFNLHLASGGQSGFSQTLSNNDLPSGQELLGMQFDAGSQDPPYKPSDLFTQRKNIPESWDESSQRIIPSYFEKETTPAGSSCPDGWPNEDYLIRHQYRRILLGWGSIDPRMQGYDFEADISVFAPDYIRQPAEVELDKDGQVTKGCFYDSKVTTVQSRNSSWAVAALDSVPKTQGDLSSCGLSPLLNATLRTSADVDPKAYVSFMQSTVWNWAEGEPRNASQIDLDDRDQQFRCALFSTSPDTAVNRWRVESCPTRHRAVCRVNHEPYSWRLTDEAIPFVEAEGECNASGGAFSVPRTGLENRYLLEFFRSKIPGEKNLADKGAGVWLNFNSLAVEQCWVSGGANATCPYVDDDQTVRQRTVLVPVIASLIVIFLAVLILFVKCNKNRRNHRKRVRREGGWDYEGVPS